MLLVTGASGQLGSLIHAGLVERGLAPLAASRDPAGFGDLGRVMDFDDEANLDFSGVATVVLVSAGYGEDDDVIARHDRVISAAEAQGVRHIVYTSLTAAGDHLGFALAHRWTERRLQASGLDWTILRNGLYAELFGQLAAPSGGVVTAPFGAGALAAVAREDLAEVAVQVALDPSAHVNVTYELAGTAALTAADLAERLGVPYEPASLAATRSVLADGGLRRFQPAMLMSIYSATAAGFLSSTRTDLRGLLPGPPRDAMTIAVTAAA